MNARASVRCGAPFGAFVRGEKARSRLAGLASVLTLAWPVLGLCRVRAEVDGLAEAAKDSAPIDSDTSWSPGAARNSHGRDDLREPNARPCTGRDRDLLLFGQEGRLGGCEGPLAVGRAAGVGILWALSRGVRDLPVRGARTGHERRRPATLRGTPSDATSPRRLAGLRRGAQRWNTARGSF